MKLMTLLFFIIQSSFFVFSNETTWIEVKEPALEKAKSEGKPILIFFHSLLSQSSAAVSRDILPDPEIQSKLDAFVLLKIDVAKDKITPKRYRLLDQLPVFIFCDPMGDEIRRWENTTKQFTSGNSGAYSSNAGKMAESASEIIKKDTLLGLMASIPKNFTSLIPAYNELAKNPKHLQSLLTIAKGYGQIGLVAISNNYFQNIIKISKDDPRVLAIAYMDLGFNYLRIKQFKKAIKSYKSSLKQPNVGNSHELAYMGTVFTYVRQKKKSKAKATFKKMAKEFPKSNFLPQAQKALNSL